MRANERASAMRVNAPRCARIASASRASREVSTAARTRVRIMDADEPSTSADAMAACEDADARGAWRARDVRRFARARAVTRTCVGAYDGQSGDLVGWACAAGDGVMVATIERVCVRRDRRGVGLGRRLVRALGRELFRREIYDVGVRVPDALRGFFETCDFDEDGSTYMRWVDDVAASGDVADDLVVG